MKKVLVRRRVFGSASNTEIESYISSEEDFFNLSWIKEIIENGGEVFISSSGDDDKDFIVTRKKGNKEKFVIGFIDSNNSLKKLYEDNSD